MDNIVEFRLSEKTKERTLESKIKDKPDPMLYALHSLETIEHCVDHFENNMNQLPENSEYVANEFVDVIQNLQARIKTNIRYLAMNKMRKDFDTVPFYDTHQIMTELEFIHKHEIQNLKHWFQSLNIPLEGVSVVRLDKFRNIWQ